MSYKFDRWLFDRSFSSYMAISVGGLMAVVVLIAMICAYFGVNLGGPRIVELEGHQYVVFDGHRKGGIVHAASCPCGEGSHNTEDLRGD